MVDLIRGFALVGALVGNILYFAGYFFLPAERRAAMPFPQADSAITFLVTALIEGKVNSLFAFLFGWGFSLQMERADGETTFLRDYTRRMLSLLLIGAVHLLLIWNGDILAFYAIVGFMLLPFRRMGDRSLLVSALILVLFPTAYYSFSALTQGAVDPGRMLIQEYNDALRELGASTETGADFRLATYAQGDYLAVVRANMAGALSRYGHLISSGRIGRVLGMFVLGLYVGRKKILSHPDLHLTLFWRSFSWALPIAVVANASFGWLSRTVREFPPSPRGIAVSLSNVTGSFSLTLVYISMLVLVAQRESVRRRLAFLATTGRMTLTNYLMQSVFGIAIFYGIGLGFIGKMGATAVMALAPLIFLVQVAYSRLWLGRYLFGPVEWLWRSMSYGRMEPLRKRAE